MKTAIASAPGKLFLLGEYAVLEGAPALVTAVGQRARAEISVADGETGPEAQDTEQKVARHGRQQLGGQIDQQVKQVQMLTGPEVITESAGQVPLLAAAVSTLEKRGLLTRQILSSRLFRLDTREFHRTGKKLGLGSSAALTAALVAGLLEDTNHWRKMTKSGFLALCLAVHREFQGGLGSGADVAIAVYGGKIAYIPGQLPEQVTLPEKLSLRFIWTGVPAGTTDYITKLYQWREIDSKGYNLHLSRLQSLSEAGLSACKAGNADSFVDIVSEYNLALHELSHQAGMMFYNSVHQRLFKTAVDAGCVYKPSGAGGGDFGLIMSTHEGAIEGLEKVLHRDGFSTSLVECSGGGIEVETGIKNE